MLHNNSDEGSASITQDAKEVEEIGMSNNSATYCSNSDDFSKIIYHKTLKIVKNQYFLPLEIKVEGKRKKRRLIAKRSKIEISSGKFASHVNTSPAESWNGRLW